MSARARAMLVASVLGSVLLPIVTAHSIVPAVASHAGVEVHLGRHFELIPLVGLTAAALLPLLGILRGVIRRVAAQRRLAALTREGVPRISGGIGYVRVPGERVALFTAGLQHPVIYVTAGAERDLRPEAFRAALLHERAHIGHHDVRWLALVALAEAAVGVLPGARQLFSSLRIETEWRADQAALDAGAERQALFDAIVGAAGVAVGGAALSGVGTIDRLRWLAEPGDLPPVSEGGVAGVLAGLFAPPVVAHALIWTGIVCVVCVHHLW